MGLDNPIHIAFLLIILLLVFGAKRLPEMGHSLGSGMRGFRDALSGENNHTTEHVAPMAAVPPAPVAAVIPDATVVAVPVAPPAEQRTDAHSAVA
jgi:sec-independent protein translocase protein TatA